LPFVLNGCPECLTKQQRIDKLVEENQRLKQKLHHKERQAQEGFFGSSTPSAKIPIKPNTDPPQNSRRRGGQPGHPAHKRKPATPETADRVVCVPSAHAKVCPKCGGPLEQKAKRHRRVRECRPVVSEDIVLELPIEHCPQCDCDFHTPAPGVFPKAILGNQLLSNAVEMMYLHGIPLGRVCEQLQVSPSVLVAALHRLAKLFEDIPDTLKEIYRKATAKHADETGWRTNGKSGYAWLFATTKLSIFQFTNTRSSRVPKAVFGSEPLPGVLVVDRYAGYNKVPCAIQYCLAHLLREVQDTEKEFPDSTEVKAFVGTVAPLLASAMGLRSQPISDEEFYPKAAEVEAELKKQMRMPAQHLAIRRIQDIFTENEARLYHWARDREVPGENNLAERDLRPTVIARKTSFGSQSEAGAQTRGTLMTVVHTLKKQSKNPTIRLKAALDLLAQDPSQAPFRLLFPELTPT
jgi:transposase